MAFALGPLRDPATERFTIDLIKAPGCPGVLRGEAEAPEGQPGQGTSDAVPSVLPPSGLSVLIRVRLELRRHQRAGHTIPRIFQAVVQRQPERLALVDAGTGECWTFVQLDAYSNAVANLFRQLGFAPGDVVAVFLEGRPEFVGLWLGLAKAGMEAALLNVNLRREPLAFCLGTSGAKALIFGGEMAAGEARRGHQVGGDPGLAPGRAGKCCAPGLGRRPPWTWP